jgi:hypothetical protein
MGITLLPKEHKVAPRWKRTDYAYVLADTNGEQVATIRANGYGGYSIKTRNRSGGWLYAYAGTLRTAKAKAAKMIREEARG